MFHASLSPLISGILDVCRPVLKWSCCCGSVLIASGLVVLRGGPRGALPLEPFGTHALVLSLAKRRASSCMFVVVLPVFCVQAWRKLE